MKAMDWKGMIGLLLLCGLVAACNYGDDDTGDADDGDVEDDDTGDDDDSDDDDAGSGDECGVDEFCDRMLECGFEWELETCYENTEACLDPDGMVECMCGCAFSGGCAPAELCLGECAHEYCY